MYFETRDGRGFLGYIRGTMRLSALFGFGLLALAGCTQPNPQGAAGSPLVFVHGFKGSILRDAEGQIQLAGIKTPSELDFYL